MAEVCVCKFESQTMMHWSGCSFTWIIDNISDLSFPSYKPLLSTKFSTESKHTSQPIWQLKLYKSNNLINCEAIVISSGSKFNTHTCRISFLDIGKKTLFTGTDNVQFLSVNEQELFKSLINDQLTIFCEVNVGPKQAEAEVCLHRSMKEKIEKFHGNQFLTDVDLEVTGKTFKGHKLMLAAVSPVFEKMFQGNSQEHQNNRVIIEDVDADVFEEVMTYIYSGQLPHLKEMSSDLLAVAGKYSILPLLQICMTDLLENMSVDDAAATYVLADRHSLHQVKPVIIHFMKKHFYEVAASAGWISLGNHHPQLIKEIQDKLREKTV